MEKATRAMRLRLTLMLLAIMAALIGYQFIPSEPTEADLTAIRQAVSKRTPQAILGIESLPSGSVVVTTGWVKGPLNGDGEFFRLRKLFGKWWVYSKSHWAM
jgi:hypothetical protein